MTLIYPSINNRFAWVVKIAQTWPGLMLILVVVLVGRKWLRFPVRKVSPELLVVGGHHALSEQ